MRKTDIEKHLAALGWTLVAQADGFDVWGKEGHGLRLHVPQYDLILDVIAERIIDQAER